ncbi:hypothetical protein G7046_g4155 [Stylonectria norvegica]|nr:hypothetical protein G7046_g4155 [Stylonectria norvegica]
MGIFLDSASYEGRREWAKRQQGGREKRQQPQVATNAGRLHRDIHRCAKYISILVPGTVLRTALRARGKDGDLSTGFDGGDGSQGSGGTDSSRSSAAPLTMSKGPGVAMGQPRDLPASLSRRRTAAVRERPSSSLTTPQRLSRRRLGPAWPVSTARLALCTRRRCAAIASIRRHPTRYPVLFSPLSLTASSSFCLALQTPSESTSHAPSGLLSLSRVKYAPKEERDHGMRHEESIVTLPVNRITGTISPAESVSGSMTEAPLFDDPWMMQSDLSSTSQDLFAPLVAQDMAPSWAQEFPAPQPAGLDLELSPTATYSEPRRTSYQTFQTPRLPRLLPAIPADPPDGGVRDTFAPARDSRKRKPPSRPHLISPFSDDGDRLVSSIYPRYDRPLDGQVNGYVKFNWPKNRRGSSVRQNVPEIPTVLEDDVEELPPQPTVSRSSSIVSTVSLIGPVPAPSSGYGLAMSPMTTNYAWTQFPSPPPGSISPPSLQHSDVSMVISGDPGLLPPLFGYHAKMDRIDRRLWQFYVHNWCPGRSVLNNTNLWLKDFAQMHENEGIRCAIQSLAGVYIYDYLPDESIRKRINDRYALADAHFSRLLAAPESHETGKGSEVITMAVILSMQDIVLTERRLKKPYAPRWLEGFKQGEHFLQTTDPGSRFWRDEQVQLTGLRISQSIIVGRTVILAQPMMELPSPATLDPEQEASRFGWLLYGTDKDMYEIHGGCGFSKKLLHTMSQVTYCAARLQQERDSTIVPITARFLSRQLHDMRQWSSESLPWDDVHQRPPTIDWVRRQEAGYVIDTNQQMTHVTAEAWRLAVILYLQCRVFRLPRNHEDVLVVLTDLASCIRIMPTSGSHFTAQAPLLPVFFLGMLATEPEHKEISRAWFEEVVRTPVRSVSLHHPYHIGKSCIDAIATIEFLTNKLVQSVPPLYQALKRIWAWIDTEIEITTPIHTLPRAIGMRRSWWERLVATVHEKEEETLCLT